MFTYKFLILCSLLIIHSYAFKLLWFGGDSEEDEGYGAAGYGHGQNGHRPGSLLSYANNGPSSSDYGECDWFDPTFQTGMDLGHSHSQSGGTFFGTSVAGGVEAGYDTDDPYSTISSSSYHYKKRNTNYGHGFGLGMGGSVSSSSNVRNSGYFNQDARPPNSYSSMGSEQLGHGDRDTLYNANDLTASHKTLPLGSFITVINENNQRSVRVRIIDNYGPNVVGRIMTLSQAAFHQIADLDERVVPCFINYQ